MNDQPRVPIDSIRIGERYRQDMGDIEGFAAEIAEIGHILEPIVINGDRLLIGGERRLLAAKHLGWTTVPVHVVDIDDVLMGQFAENAHRKAFTLSECVRFKRALEARDREVARQRKGFRTDLRGKLPAGAGRIADKAARATGITRRTLEKAEVVFDAGEADPDKFGKLQADMDRTGRVDGVYRRLKIAKQAELIRAEPPPFPGNGPYRFASVDFPWAYEIRQEDPSHRAARQFPTMNIDQILAFARDKLRPLMHDDSVLALWSPNLHLIRCAAPVLDAAGFSERTLLTWVKGHFGHGDILRSQTEQCVIAVRGKPTLTLTNESTVLFAPARGDSVKPPEFYDLVEQWCPATRYLDVFSRYRHSKRWDCFGDQAPPDSESVGEGFAATPYQIVEAAV